MSELERAVDRLSQIASARPMCETERRQLEAARDCLAAYAAAARDLTGAGVGPGRVASLIDRGYREASMAFDRAKAARANRDQVSAAR
jgi:hypothetical protein